MFYIDSDRTKLEAYNTQVKTAEGYDGTHTKNWAEILEHPNGEKFAILKHPSHEVTEMETATATEIKNWFDNDI